MSKTVKIVNKFFKDALRKEIEEIKSELVLSDRQAVIFELFYEKKKDVNYIADTIGCCSMVVHIELKKIRSKLMKLWEMQNEHRSMG